MASQHEELARETIRARDQKMAEASRLTFLLDYVLTSAPMARLWWIGSNPEKLIQLADMKDGVFETAIDLLMEREAGKKENDQIAQIIESFLRDLGPEHRKLLIAQIDRVFRNYERADLAERLGAAQQFVNPVTSSQNSRSDHAQAD
jgi:hypothetical protein